MSNKIWSSSLIAITGSVIEKCIGILSTAFVARILAPSDFGIIAIALFFFELCSSLGDLGTQKFLLRNKTNDFNIYNQTFSFRFLSLNVQAIILILFSESIALYFKIPDLCLVLKIYALIICIKSIQNVYFFKLYSDFNYSAIVKIDVIVKLASASSGILLAYYLENYFALVYSQLISSTLLVTRTYLMIDERPKFDFSNLKSNWSFSKWLLLETIIGYIRGKFDTTLTASRYDITTVGNYDVAKSNGQLPLQSISEPLSPIFLSKFAHALDKNNQNEIYQNLLKIISLFFSPILIIILLNMDLFISILLGEKWINSILLFQAFAVMSYFSIFNAVNSSYYIAKGNMSFYSALNMIITVIYVIIMIYFSSNAPTIEAFTLARVSFIPTALFISIVSAAMIFNISLTKSIINIFCYFLLSVFLGFVFHFFISDSDSFFFRLFHALIYIFVYLIFAGVLIVLSKDDYFRLKIRKLLDSVFG